MFNRMLKKMKCSLGKEEGELAVMEISELEEVADRIYEKLEKKMEALDELELRVDEKLRSFAQLLDRAAALQAHTGQAGDHRRRAITAMAGKGLKIDEIANILDMPKGEVELVLGLAG